MKTTTLLLAPVLTLAMSACVTTQGTGPGAKEDGSSASVSSVFAPIRKLFSTPGSDAPLHTQLAPGGYVPSDMAIGADKDLAQRRGRGLGYVRQGEIEAKLAGIHARILKGSGITGVPGKVMILANPAPEALSTPDGNIYIAMQWIRSVDNEDELAAVIAHETAHVLLHHHSADIIGHTQKRLETLQQTGIAVKNQIEKVNVISKSDAKSLKQTILATELTQKLVVPAWSRRQETEADLLGLDLLIKADYSPLAMSSMLEKLDAWEKANTEQEDAFQQRISEIAMQDLGQAIKLLFSRAVTDFASNHPPTDARLEDLAVYHQKHYESLEIEDADPKAWARFTARRQIADMISSYTNAFEAYDLLLKNQPAESLTKARRAVSGEARRHAYPNWVASKASSMLGRKNDAARYLKIALAAPEPSAQLYYDIIDVYEQQRQYSNAEFWIDKAEQSFDKAPEWTVERIRIYRKMGKKKEVGQLLLKCGIESPEIKRECDQAAQDEKPA
ncbi:MAG: M48 family metallopeptidase [Rhodocyclaceae bacterium]|nr:M48 family metallopeptidase [Rhodocyclaceae bacterium]